MSEPTRRGFSQAAAGFVCASVAHAQQEPSFSTGVKVVDILATVRNKTGAIIHDLERGDFLISEDGRPQTIRYFARDTDLPLTLGLMVDTSGSQRRVLEAERGASYRFFDQVVREGTDQVFLMQFDSAVQLRQGLTSSLSKLQDTLPEVNTETQSQLRIQRGGGTLLYDAIAKAADETMRKLTGRKALILLTDGIDVGSYGTIADAVEAAQRADTLVCSILYADPDAYGIFGGANGRSVLQRISSETGGSFFEVSKRQTIDQVFDILQRELRTQYNIGYVSDKPVTLSEFRSIQLTARQKGLIVQARHKYWAQR